jgi:hypothetical protein
MPQPTKYQRDAAAIQRRLAESKQAREKHAHEAVFLEAQLRQVEKDERRRLQAQVGRLADDAGLLAYDLGLLEKAFADLKARLEDQA